MLTRCREVIFTAINTRITMDSMICRIITLFLLAGSLAACAFHKPSQKIVEVEEAAIDRNAKLIEQQQSVLESQSARLEELSVIQQELGNT